MTPTCGRCGQDFGVDNSHVCADSKMTIRTWPCTLCDRLFPSVGERNGHEVAAHGPAVVPTADTVQIRQASPEEEQALIKRIVDLNSKPTNPKDVIGIRKVPMSVVPAGVLLELGLAMLEGTGKYGRHNYRAAGVRSSVYYDAGMGHMMDWWEGDDIDADSGLSHVIKAIASLVVLRDAMLQGMLTDDRPPRSKVYKRDFNGMAGEILDRHADKHPHHYTIGDKL